MNELIKVTEQDGKQAVSARDLHDFLGNKQQFGNWITNRIKKYDLLENEDYIVFNYFINNPNGGRPLTEYALSLDCAKELAMVEGNAKGKQARKYFIECEKELKSLQKPMSELEILQKNVTILIEQDKKLKEHDNRILQLEAKTTTRPNYFTIVGYGTLHNMSVNLRQACSLGQKASKMCKERGYETDFIPDPRFGKVKMYPENVLNEVFELAIN